jgi:4-hydroxybenzoate polyprenyl transferase
MKKLLKNIYQGFKRGFNSFKVTPILAQMLPKRLTAVCVKNPYLRLMRVDKPVGFWLLVLPLWWSIAITYHSIKDLLWFVFFTLAAFLMRSAGCIINDMWDREIDKKVDRTRSRPIASGEVSMRAASFLLLSLLGAALMMSMLLPWSALKTALFCIIPIVIYPVMKRVFFAPQVFLGFTFNLGVLVVWQTTMPGFFLIGIVLYVASAIWTIAYDTIYAHQDRIDDKKHKIMSLAVALGDKTYRFAFHSYILFFALVVLVGANAHMNLFFYLGMFYIVNRFYVQVDNLDIDNPKSCHKAFLDNVEIGWMIFIFMVIGRF